MSKLEGCKYWEFERSAAVAEQNLEHEAFGATKLGNPKFPRYISVSGEGDTNEGCILDCQLEFEENETEFCWKHSNKLLNSLSCICSIQALKFFQEGLSFKKSKRLFSKLFLRPLVESAPKLFVDH